MKICPKCQQQYPNGFQYCPSDTEVLLTNEEFMRRANPLAAPPVAERKTPIVEHKTPSAERTEDPNVDIVPLKNQTSEETGTKPRKPVVSPPPNPQGQGAKEPPVPLSFRKPEQQPSAEEAPRRPQPVSRPTPPTPRPAPPSPAPPSRSTPTPRAASSGTPPPRPFQTPKWSTSNSQPTLNFSMPDQGGLFARLLAGLKNIGDVFKSGPAVRPGAAGDFKFLIPEEPLLTRIFREIWVAFGEFRRNPRQFIVDFIKGEGTNRQRRNALLAGSEMAFVGLVTIYFISMAVTAAVKESNPKLRLGIIGFAVYLLGCYLVRGLLLYKLVGRAVAKFGVPKAFLEFAQWGPIVAIFLLSIFLKDYNFYCRVFPDRCIPPEEMQLVDKQVLLQDVAIAKPEIKVQESPKAQAKKLGGSKPKPKPASGGGGGGKQVPTPPSKGVPPVMALTPPIRPPDPTPPKIKNPSMPVPSTIYGDPKIIAMKGPIGDPTGVPAPPSPGPGKGDGIGRGSGQGVGSGQGGGQGPGRGGNVGGGDMGLGGGASVQPMSANLKPTILYKEKAKYTEEARQNKIQGTVVLSVVFNADGTISSPRVVRGLPDGLTEKAIEAARKIRFQPAVKNGVAVPVRGNLEFTFNLY